MELTELEKAYMAGCMDSDGCFGIKLKKWNGYSQYVPRVSFGQTSIKVVSLFKQAFGGGIHTIRKTPPAKDLFMWDVTSTTAACVCTTLLPYLILKSRQAKLLLELHGTKDMRYSGTGVPVGVLKHRERLYDQVRALNRRGIDPKANKEVEINEEVIWFNQEVAKDTCTAIVPQQLLLPFSVGDSS